MGDNRAVWKFDLPITDHPAEPARLVLPRGAEIRKIAEQEGLDTLSMPRFCLWALVDPDEPRKEVREVYTAGTGHVFPSIVTRIGCAYTETLLAMGGTFVLHVWISQPTSLVE